MKSAPTAMTPAQRQALCRSRKAARGKAKDIALASARKALRLIQTARTIEEAGEIADIELEKKQ
jgi:hypothetical protein